MTDAMQARLIRRAGEGFISACVLFLAHWPALFAAALFARALSGGEYAVAFVVLSAIFVIGLPPWRDRVYSLFARSHTCKALRLL